MKRTQIGGLLIAVGMMIPGAGFSREFISSDGAKMEGEIVTVSGSDVIILRSDNRRFTIPIDKFSAEDQTYIKEWAVKEAANKIPKLEVAVNTGKGRRTDRADGFDDRTGLIHFSIVIENEERDYDLLNAKAGLVVFGQDCQYRDEYVVFQKAYFPVNVKEGESQEWTGEEMSYPYDDREPAVWGHEYYGYTLVIQNEQGKVIFTKSLPKKFEGKEEAALQLERRTVCDDNMKKKTNAMGSVYFD